MRLNRQIIRDIGDTAYTRLIAIPHVLSITAESTKFTANQDTKVPCITVFVDRKLPESELSPEHVIPKQINGIPVDVVELSSEAFQIGETPVSRQPPSIQRVIAGGVRR